MLINLQILRVKLEIVKANLRQNPTSKAMEIAERRFENLLRQFSKFFLGNPKFQTQANS